MDFRLPGIDGVEPTRRIRRLEGETGRRAVIIGITAGAMDSDHAAALGRAEWTTSCPSPSGWRRWGRRWASRSGGLGTTVAPARWRPRCSMRSPEDLGSRVIVGELVRTFLNELHGRRATLTARGGRHRYHCARKAAHTLKSSSLLLGAELGHACQRMETVTHPADLRHTSAEILQRRDTVAARCVPELARPQPVAR